MDTQGMSAALTGGYGNSYGVLAGQQAYQNSLGDLSAQIPEMYKLAYNRYLNNEQSQRQNLAALQGLDESEYQRYANEAQAYENKIAELYQKSRSGGGGKKKQDPRSDAEWLINYSAENGWDPDVAMAALARANDWSNEYTGAVSDITHSYTDYQRQQERKSGAADFMSAISDVWNTYTGNNKTNKTP